MTNREAVHTIDAIRIITVKDCTWSQKEIDEFEKDGGADANVKP